MRTSRIPAGTILDKSRYLISMQDVQGYSCQMVMAVISRIVPSMELRPRVAMIDMAHEPSHSQFKGGGEIYRHQSKARAD